MVAGCTQSWCSPAPGYSIISLKRSESGYIRELNTCNPGMLLIACVVADIRIISCNLLAVRISSSHDAMSTHATSFSGTRAVYVHLLIDSPLGPVSMSCPLSPEIALDKTLTHDQKPFTRLLHL